MVVSSVLPADPTLPASAAAYTDDLKFVSAYLTVHMQSDASRVYSYILWIALGVVLIVCSILHHLHLGGGYLGARWSKWALRRRTWRKKHSLAVAKANGQPHKQPFSLPSNSQICTLIVIVISSLLLSFLGPDYIAPGYTLWTLQDAPYATTSITKRGYDLSQWYQYQPRYTIPKAWWTAGNRTGLIAFALFPLCVLFALKAPPFAIFSIPFLVQFYCDKLLWLHKWVGRLVYLFVVLHVALWSVQLLKDKHDGKVAYVYAWTYEKFLFAWTSFGCFTLLMIFSLKPFRTKHYESFWFLHVLLAPLTIVMAALHHPPVWWWCWAAIGLWIGERTWRFTRWMYTNGILGRRVQAPSSKMRRGQSLNHGPSAFQYPPSKMAANSTTALAHYPPITPTALLPGVGLSVPTDYIPPPGYAHAELLPGHTVRLRVVTPGYITWAPGQHFLISIPSITRFTTHPFTAASICDEQNAYDDGRVLIFLIRAKNGWTRDLWDSIVSMVSRGQRFHKPEAPPPCEMPTRGVLLRTLVDGPYGSSVRASWHMYSSVLIVAGGSGVSYALSVLQYLCLCMAGRDGQFLGGHKGGHGHIQWCAAVLRRCLDILPSPELQIDIFVTNVRPSAGPKQPKSTGLADKEEDHSLPHSPLTPDSRRSSQTFTEEGGDYIDVVDLSYYTSVIQEDGELGHEEHILDYTNFEGDNDSALPGEDQFNISVKKEGKTRRATTQRASMVFLAKQELIRKTESDYDRIDISTVRPSFDLEPRETRPDSMLSTGTSNSMQSSSTLTATANRIQFQSPPNSAVPLIRPQSFAHTPLTSHSHNFSATSDFSLGHNMWPSQSSLGHELRPGAITPISPGTPGSLRSMSRLSTWTDTDSFAALVPGGDVATIREQLRLDLDELEVEDVGILERILADEIERARGAIAVACCGPTSLDAFVRKTVAAQIDPARVKRGDMRGSITLFSEEFSY
ncbi:uncharacterized protein BXZ73DRAFT_86249 [Epithele typhae]|uniref:uncharacterized protein n=1 Tax=Epithele typhae TaxID=378194 RepID=UPI00200746E5|nr:uncharacterized protein BXZ73DRAFT_86249 [Epithele typhae]KAH9946045.1 hypothetical protein BXZ73DRAFT_86249 [Epithele typhae]